MIARHLPRLILLTLAISLVGCASYHQPRYGHDGVYYDPPQVQYRAVHVDPLLYPYWSLDYFYFSRHYHPYSVLVDFYDPWYYPYPGWYYGYGAGPRTHVSISYGRQWYPWSRFGPHYAYYQPWGFRYIHYPRYRHDSWVHQPRVRQVDERLREMERRQRTQTAAYRGPRPPATHADAISTRRSAAGSRQADPTRRQASDVRRTIRQREQSPVVGMPRARQPAPRVLLPERGTTGPERRTIRAGSPRESQRPAPRQREGIPTRSVPRQQPTRPDVPRQRPSSREPAPAVRQRPSSPPSQPTTRPQRQSPPPSQPRAPARQRQREHEPLD